MLISRRLILLLISTLSCYCYSQSSFSVLFQHPQDERVLDIVEDLPGTFYAVGYAGYNNEPNAYKGLIYKIRSATDTLSRKVVFSDTVTRMFKICKAQNHQFLLFGSISYPPIYTEKLLIMKIDSNLNTIWKKEYKLFDYDHFYRIDYLKGSNNSIWLFGNLGILATGQYDVFFLKINNNGDTLKSGEYTPWNPTLNCGIFSSDSSKLWFFGESFDYNGIGQRAEFDTNFILQRVDWIPTLVNGNMNARWHSDSTLLFIGKYYLNSSPQDDEIGISFIDTTLNTPNIQYFGAADTCDNPGAERCIDFIEPNRTFFTGVHNVIFDFFPEGVSWIMMGLLNADLEPIYERYYGGDAYYIPSSILATQDNGSIIAATRYDYKAQNFERDVLFLKLDENGLITSNPISPKADFVEINVFPNPSSDYIHIETPAQNQLAIMNLSGQDLINQQITEPKTRIDISTLPNGIYFVRVTGEKMVQVRKFIKQ